MISVILIPFVHMTYLYNISEYVVGDYNMTMIGIPFRNRTVGSTTNASLISCSPGKRLSYFGEC